MNKAVMEFPKQQTLQSTGITHSNSDFNQDASHRGASPSKKAIKNGMLSKNLQFKKELRKYEINYNLDSVFQYRPDDQEVDVKELKENYWHKRQCRYTSTGYVEAKKVSESDDEVDDGDMSFDIDIRKTS